MIHKAWKVPYYFARSSVKFQGHTAQNIVNFDSNWALWESNSNLNPPMATKWRSTLEVALLFSRSSVKFQCHKGRNIIDLTQTVWFPDCISSFTDDYEMILKAWDSLEDVPYCFSMSPVKLQGHTGYKISDFDPNLAFPDCNSNLNSPMDFKCCTKLDVI